MNFAFLLAGLLLGIGGYESSAQEEPLSGNELEANISQINPIDDIFFTFLRKENEGPSVIISPDNSSEFLKSLFRQGQNTKLIVHGWLGSSESFIVKNIGEEYVESQGANVIAVDWSVLASWMLYPLAASNVNTVGEMVAKMVDRLVDSQATSLNKVHLIGHSLGAHVMGIAGSNIKAGKVSRITGLDPAKPGFEFIAYEENRLDKSDAKFVDVIHSSSGTVGFIYPLGHADFYPNGGTPPQPGCFEPISDPMKLLGCSHGRSYEFYAESIKNPKAFKAVQCDSWSSFKKNMCENNTVAFMGDAASSDAQGTFYLETNSESPFYRTSGT